MDIGGLDRSSRLKARCLATIRLNHLTARDVPAAEGSLRSPRAERRGRPDSSEPARAHSAGEAVGTTAAGGDDTGLSTLSSPGSVACAISHPGLVTGYARTRGDAPRAVICTGRALHDLSSLLLRAPAPARPACDPTNPCTRPTRREACHVPTHPPRSPRTAGADRSRHSNRAGGPRAGGQFMVAAGPATRRMRVVRVPARAGGQRGRRGGRRRNPAERRQQLFRTGLYQLRRAASCS